MNLNNFKKASEFIIYQLYYCFLYIKQVMLIEFKKNDWENKKMSFRVQTVYNHHWNLNDKVIVFDVDMFFFWIIHLKFLKINLIIFTQQEAILKHRSPQ